MLVSRKPQYKDVYRRTIEMPQRARILKSTVQRVYRRTIEMPQCARIPKATVQIRLQENSRNATTCSYPESHSTKTFTGEQ